VYPSDRLPRIINHAIDTKLQLYNVARVIPGTENALVYLRGFDPTDPLATPSLQLARLCYEQAMIGQSRILWDRLMRLIYYDDRLHRLISEDLFRQRWDQLEEKRSRLSRDLGRHQRAEGADMELGSKLIELIAQAPQIFERADPEQRRELVGLLTSNPVLKGRTLEFELRKPFDALVSAANRENGWGVRIRTAPSAARDTARTN